MSEKINEFIKTKKFKKFGKWILLFLLWGLIVVNIIYYSGYYHTSPFIVLPLVILYIFYVIWALQSPTLNILNSKKRGTEMVQEYMKSLYSACPIITWQVDCWHHEVKVLSQRR